MIVKVALSGFHMLKQTMKSRKKHAFIFLFTAYFLFYVLSPFCLAEDGIPENLLSSYKTDRSSKNIRVVWELILSNLFNNNENDSSRSNVQVLLKKARALVSSNNVVKLKPSEFAGFDYIGIFLSPDFYPSSGRNANPEYRTGSYLSVSGLSPPCSS